MNYRGFMTLLAILAIPKFGMADTVPAKGLSYDLKAAAACASDSPTNGKYDLYAVQLADRCVDFTLPSTSAASNQLTAVTFNRATTSDGNDVYILNATFNAFVNGVSLGQAGELVAFDGATGQTFTPKNTTMNNQPKCMPSMTGNVAHFNCIYPMSLNKISNDSKIHMMVLLPGAVTLYNPKVMTLADFATPAPAASTSAPQPATTCQAPTPVLGLDGSCAVSCGPNQTEDKTTASCKCSDGFTLDPQTKNACIAATPDANAPASPMYGHHCSLNPNATPNSQPQTILALLLLTVIAARAWHYSKN